MRLSAPGEQYEFDLKFYAISLCGILLIAAAFWKGKQMIDRATGREVQRLITRENLDSPQAFQRQAKNYIAGGARHHKLTPAETAKAEEIYAEGLYRYGKTWSQGRINAESPSEIKRKQAEVMRETNEKFQVYLRSIGK